MSVCECRARSTLVVAGGYTSPVTAHSVPLCSFKQRQMRTAEVKFIYSVRCDNTILGNGDDSDACMRMFTFVNSNRVWRWMPISMFVPTDDVVCHSVARISLTSLHRRRKNGKRNNLLALCGRCEFQESTSESPSSSVAQIQCFQFHFVKCPKSIINLFGERRRRTLSRLHCALCAQTHKHFRIIFFVVAHAGEYSEHLFHHWKQQKMETKATNNQMPEINGTASTQFGSAGAHTHAFHGPHRPHTQTYDPPTVGRRHEQD